MTIKVAKELLQGLTLAGGGADDNGDSKIQRGGPWSELKAAATVRMGGRPLFKTERQALSEVLHSRFDDHQGAADIGSASDGSTSPRLLLLTALHQTTTLGTFVQRQTRPTLSVTATSGKATFSLQRSWQKPSPHAISAVCIRSK